MKTYKYVQLVVEGKITQEQICTGSIGNGYQVTFLSGIRNINN